MKKSIILSILILIIGMSYVSGLGYYTDMHGHWSSRYVYWATHEAMVFREDFGNSFRPEARMTRGDFVYLLDKVLQHQNMYKDKSISEPINYYTDIDESYWGYDSIQSVANYINEYTNHEYNFYNVFPFPRLSPNSAITRYEAALLARAVTTYPVSEGTRYTFKDLSPEIKYYSSILELINNSILKGYGDGTFKPNNRVTRGEAAVIAKKVYDDLNYLQKDYLRFYPIETTNGKETMPLFETRSNSSSYTLLDRKYIEAITSLEYISFIGYIPYEERHLYDLNPVDTLWELKNQDYYNVIGVNYYLLKGDKKLVVERKRELVWEALQHYALIEDKNIEGIYDFLKIAVNYISKENLIEALQNILADVESFEEAKAAALFVAEAYYSEGRYYDAMLVYRQLLGTEEDIKARVQLISNYLYLLSQTSGYDAAVIHLEVLWEDIKGDRQYAYYRNQIDSVFTAIFKQLKMK